MNKQALPLMLLLALAAQAHADEAVLAGEGAGTGSGPVKVHAERVFVGPAGAGFGEALRMGGAIGFVKNAPYSADIVTERTQSLQDGNQISVKTTRRSFRDSAGRTRQEILNDKGDVTFIHIADRAAGAQYSLDPARKTGTRVVVTEGRRLPDHIRPRLARSSSSPGVIVHHEVRTGTPDGQAGTDKVEVIKDVRIVTGGEHHPERAMHLARAIGTDLADRKWAQSATTTRLGTRDFDGVKAEGSSTSFTIPAGEIGNRNPITVSSESWYSPELQMMVYMKKSDPRSGDTAYRVANIRRAEPGKSLFEVPSDYKISDAPAGNFFVRELRKN